MPTNYSSNPLNNQDIVTFGVAWQPIDQIVFKLDYEDWERGPDSWNLAMGYVF